MNRFSQLMAFVLGGAIAFALLQTLSACTEGSVRLDQVVRVFGVERIDPSAERELKRYYETYALYSNDPVDERQREHFRDAFRLVQSHYVTEVEPAHLIDAAVQAVEDTGARPGSLDPRELVETSLDAMMAELDPHSSYMNPDEYRESRIVTRGEFGGLGIEVTMEDEVIKVVSPIEDTPAQRAGIEAGDKIIRLDGELVKGKTLSDAVKIMRGRPGTRIILTIQRDGLASPFDVTIVRAVIQVRSVRWHLEGDIGYVKITSFTEQVEDKLTQAMDDMFAMAATMPERPLKGIVLDLRNNPGGLLDQSLFVSDAFLEGGEIVSVRERDSRNDRVFLAEPGDLSRGLPMVVLINEGSASASEIVAGALKDHSRAVVMGRRSFGKGSVQTIQPLPVEGALRLTTARYFAPSGHTIQARGVAPDIVITRPEVKDEDAALQIRREADLPGALSGDSMAERAVQATLAREACPQAGPEGEDQELGCALAYLHAGTTAAFLKALAPRAEVPSGTAQAM